MEPQTEPWRHRTDWASGRLESETGGLAPIVFIWVFVVLWNAVSWPAAIEAARGNASGATEIAPLFPAIGAALPRICRAVLKATGANAYNVLQNNGPMAHQAVLHVHFHIIPKREDGAGLGVGWKPRKLDHAEAAKIAGKIAGLIESVDD